MVAAAGAKLTRAPPARLLWIFTILASVARKRCRCRDSRLVPGWRGCSLAASWTMNGARQSIERPQRSKKADRWCASTRPAPAPPRPPIAPPPSALTPQSSPLRYSSSSPCPLLSHRQRAIPEAENHNPLCAENGVKVNHEQARTGRKAISYFGHVQRSRRKGNFGGRLHESTVTKNLGEGELAFRKQIDRSCLQATEHTSMLGQDVVKVHGVQGPSERSSESTEWKAPDLDCFTLSSTHVLSVPSGNPVATTTVETLFVVEGEPQPALFELPAGYKERSPSQLADEYARRFGGASFFGPSFAQGGGEVSSSS